MSTSVALSPNFSGAIMDIPDEKKFVLILYVGRGKNFPGDFSPYPDGRVVVEASLDDDSLHTDGVSMVGEQVQFKEELGWKLRGDELKEMVESLKTVSVKVLIVNPANPENEFVLLGSHELAVSGSKPPGKASDENSMMLALRWIKLQGGHINLQKPLKFQLLLYYEPYEPEKTQDLEQEYPSFQSDQQKKPRLLSARTPKISSSDGDHFKFPTPGNVKAVPILAPVLNENLGCFILGPEERATHVFHFTVQIIFGKNLQLAIHKDDVLPPDPEFNFHVRIFSFDISTLSFKNLVSPEFRAETFTVRIASTPDDIAAYFTSQAEPLTISMLCGPNQVSALGIPLTSLMTIDSAKILREKFQLDQIGIMSCLTPGPSQREGAETARLGYSLILECAEEYVRDETDASRAAADSFRNESSQWVKSVEKTVVDLEEWKLKQKEKFLGQLRECEASHNSVLANEWRRREEEREKMIQERFAEIQSLAEQLKLKLECVLKREKTLEAREASMKINGDQQREKKDEKLFTQRLFQAEFKRTLAKEREEKSELLKELKRAEEKAQQELAKAKQKFEEDKKKLEEDKKLLLQNLDRALKCKTTYKSAWEDAEGQLKKLEKENELRLSMQLQNALDQNEQLKAQVENMKRSNQVPVPAVRVNPPNARLYSWQESGAEEEAASGDPELDRQKKLTRLRASRKALLRTSSYKEGDTIIKGIDEQIDKLLE